LIIVFRVDASIAMGTGHVMRCLTLADEFKKNYAVHVLFISRAHQGYLADYIQDKGFELKLLPSPVPGFQPSPEDVAHAKWLNVPWRLDAEETINIIASLKPDWLVVDHYSLDARWHSLLRPYVNRILVIDDLADRKLDCDILLDQTYGREKKDYRNLVNKNCRTLLGSRFALLRPEFVELRAQAIIKRKYFNGINRILVTMGGTDSKNLTSKILDSLAQINWSTNPYIDVVMGGHSPYLKVIQKMINNYPLNISISIDVSDMAVRMLKADLAIGAGGSTAWERCCLGLPTLAFCLAENQKLILQEIDKIGGLINLGKPTQDTDRKIKQTFHSLDKSKEIISNISDQCITLVDGAGVSRVVKEISNSL